VREDTVVTLTPVFIVTRHALRQFPLLYLAVVLSVVSVASELAAMATLFPLAEMAAGRSISRESVWAALPALFPKHSPTVVFLTFFSILLTVRVATVAVVALLNAKLHRELIAHFSANAFDSFVNRLSFREIQEHKIGHFITLAGDEANRASQIVAALARLLPTVLLALLYLVSLFIYSTGLGLALIGFMLVSGIALLGAFRRSHRLGSRQQSESRELNTFFIDALGGLRTVRGFNAEAYAVSRYRDMIGQYARTCFSVDAVNILGRALPAVLLLLIIVVAIALWLDQDFLNEHLAFGMAATILVLRFLPLVGQALETFLRLTADLRAGKHVADVVELAERADPRDQSGAREQIPPLRRIEFDQVSFSYSDETPVMKNFSAVLSAGKIYAIVGPSGAGKSTLIDLLFGFYAPTGGRILVNGTDMRHVDRHALRSRMAIVEQQARLLTDTIGNNLKFGRRVDRTDVLTAARLAHLDDVIATLPQGYETVVSYQGANFSGGQRQRIGIARALVKAADVLVLDESTAGLDSATRDRIFANLKNAYSDRILVLLTHDNDLISQVDEVIAMECCDPAITAGGISLGEAQH
jgi:ABC-type multidrug transport system fused ATPase/permease subunit